MIFKPLELEDMDLLRPYLQKNEPKVCNYSSGTFFMWRKYHNTRFALVTEEDFYVIFIKITSEKGGDVFQLPITNNMGRALELLFTEEKTESLRFEMIPEAKLPLFRENYSVSELIDDRDNYDYLYNIEELAELRGKRFHGQRNQISQFIRGCKSWEITPFADTNLPEVLRFFDENYMPQVSFGILESSENEAVREVLTHPGIYRLSGIVLYRDGAVAGFAMGEKIGDTLFVHIEKSHREIHGAYQLLVKSLAASYRDTDVRFVNREDDSADEGLRRSKLSYHPIELIKKYCFTISKKSVK